MINYSLSETHRMRETIDCQGFDQCASKRNDPPSSALFGGEIMSERGWMGEGDVTSRERHHLLLLNAVMRG